MYRRRLEMNLPKGQSAFLWGARQTGKSSWLKQHFRTAVYYDLLNTDEMIRLTRSPFLLREELLSLPPERLVLPVIIDEVQKVPDLLNEVHWLIENHGVSFILCGSSARKLRTQSVNLLGGRAWEYHFYPLSFSEIPDFDLLRALQQGLLPRHWLSDPRHIADHLEAYVSLYLTDEIRNEGLVRNLQGFARFLDVVGLCNGEMVNASHIGRDCGVDRQTVQGFFQILEDTLLGYHIYPWRKKRKRDLVMATPKFYLFDTGVANFLARQTVSALRGAVAGRSFEHYILMELIAWTGISRKRQDITYWRTKTGLEVDFIVGEAKCAIEVKITGEVHKEDLKGLVAFCEEYPEAKACVVSLDQRPRKIEINGKQTISVMPWQVFLEQLWQGNIV